MSESIIKEKALGFAKRIVDMYQYLTREKNEFILSKQIFRSGTSIGANVTEGLEAESRDDFKHKLHIALKETSETIYWLELLRYGEYITEKQYKSINKDAWEIKKILRSIIKTIVDGNTGCEDERKDVEGDVTLNS